MLCQAVRQSVTLDFTHKDGSTLREHLLSVERQTGLRDAALDVSRPDESAEYLLGWFWELSATRGSNGFGPSRITHTEIRSWADNLAITIRPWEVRLLVLMDSAYMVELAIQQKNDG